MLYVMYMSNIHLVYFMENENGRGPKAQGIFQQTQQVKKMGKTHFGHVSLRACYEDLGQRPKYDTLFHSCLYCIVLTNFVYLMV